MAGGSSPSCPAIHLVLYFNPDSIIPTTRIIPNPFRKARIFLGETSTELKKAVWPTKSELRDSTIVVFIATLLLGAYIALADFSVYNWIQLLTNWVKG